MPSSYDIPEPTGGAVLPWVMNNPDAPAMVVRRVNKLAAMQFKLTQAGGANPKIIQGSESDQNILVSIPIQFAKSVQEISVFAGTFSSTPTGAQCTALADSVKVTQGALNQLISQLRSASINL